MSAPSSPFSSPPRLIERWICQVKSDKTLVLFPGTADQAGRWRTSNNEYGRFYLSLSREALGAKCRADGLHSECNRRCEQLARELCEVKSELDHLRIGSRVCSPREREGCRDPPHHNGDCLFSERARMPCDDMFHTTHDIEYNGGRRTEPQVLEDHLRADHPRLVKKVPPLNPIGSSAFDGIPEQGGAQSERDPSYGRGRVSKYWTGDNDDVRVVSASGVARSGNGMNEYRRPESAGSAGLGAGGQMPSNGGDYQRDSGGQTSPRFHHQNGAGGYAVPSEEIRKPPTPKFRRAEDVRYRGGGATRSENPRDKILPLSQRYNFYRYYGFAGQGAKTSRGWTRK